jgi:hypothetical protein
VVTLGATEFTVTATNNNDVKATAYEIANGDFDGWTAEQRGDKVVFLSNGVGTKTNDFTLEQTGAGTPAAGTFAQTLAGVASTDTWVTQANWNVDKLDGTGPSGFNLDPTKGNVYQIGIQYLGFGPVSMSVEMQSGNNNPTFVTAHNFSFLNSLTGPHTTQPSFPFTMSAYSAGSTTDVSVKSGSFAGFIEGEKHLNGPRMTYQRETSNYVGSAAGTVYPLFTVRNGAVHGHGIVERANQSVVNLLSSSCSHDDATPVTFFLIRNATLTGPIDFTQYSTSSCTYFDEGATGCTFDDNDQLIFTQETGQASGETFSFEDEIELQPGETVTIAARAVTGTATWVTASLNTREDQ